jgi:hypothetical protein
MFLTKSQKNPSVDCSDWSVPVDSLDVIGSCLGLWALGGAGGGWVGAPSDPPKG